MSALEPGLGCIVGFQGVVPSGHLCCSVLVLAADFRPVLHAGCFCFMHDTYGFVALILSRFTWRLVDKGQACLEIRELQYTTVRHRATYDERKLEVIYKTPVF